MPNETTKFNRDSYYVLTVTMTKVSFKIFCRGYDIKSWMAFQESVGAEYVWEETTREAYEDYYCQPLDVPLDDDEGSTKAPPEKKSRKKKAELPFSSLETFFSPAKNPGKNKIEKKRV